MNPVSVTSGPGPGLRLLFSALRGARVPALKAAAWSVVEAAPALAGGWVLAAAVDRGFLAGRAGTGLAWLALLGVLHAVRALAERQIMTPLADIVEPLRDDLESRVVRAALHAAVHGTRPVGAAEVSRLTGQVDSVRSVVAALLRTARPLAVTLVAALTGLASLDPLLALVVVVPLAAAVAVFVLSMRVVHRRRREVLLAEEDVATATGAVLAAGRDVLALGAEERAIADVARAVDASTAAATRQAWAGAIRPPVILAGGSLPVLLILLAGPSLLARGQVTPGAMVGAVMYVSGYLLPALRLMTGSVAGLWSQLRVTAGRLAEATRTPRTDRSAVRTPPPAAGEADPAPDLVVDDLTFAYGAGAEPVLSGLTLTVPAGEHLAVVGASGIGKSTLAGLLAGLEHPDSGSVRLGGRPVRPGRVALLPQEAYVFPGTVRENLCLLAPGLDDAALDAAVAAVGAASLVARLGGHDAEIVAPARELSGGERQLLALARVYASAADVVILDEATSGLDPAAERTAEEAFAARPGTLIVIAHRLSSAVRADRVLVLDGDRTELGSHDRLLAAGGVYALLSGHWAAAPAGAVS